MAAVASIKLTQGAHTDSPGVSVIGDLDPGGACNITNGNNTDVHHWEIELFYTPPDSAVAPALLASAVSGSPAASFTPDKPGCYRVRERVWDVYGVMNEDIRNLGILNARGILVPPYQKNPDPIDILLKADELNFGGQAFGWVGDRATGLHETFFYTYDDLPFIDVVATPFTAAATHEAPLYIVDLATIGSNAVFNLPASGWRVGQSFRVQAIGGTLYVASVVLPGGHTVSGESSVVILDGFGEMFTYLGKSTWVLVGTVPQVGDAFSLQNYLARKVML